MNNEQKLEAVRQKIIEAVPEIKKPGFGCKVYRPSYHYGVIIEKYYDDYSFDIFFPTSVRGMEKMNIQLDKSIKIIGCTIRLSHVLTAITESKYSLRDQYKYPIWDAETPTVGDVILYEWNFSDDDLNLQSPETIDFLYNLFK
jgi:hypothetical protein